MSCLDVPIQTILGTECIGDSLPKIMGNFNTLGDATCDLITKVNTLSTNLGSLSASGSASIISLSSTVDANFIPKPASASAQQVLTYDGSTTTWVASAAPDGSTGPTSAKAWVNFDGTLATPSVTNRNYNVSSVTKNSAGKYTVNFAIALNDVNYSTACDAGGYGTQYQSSKIAANASGVPLLKTTTQCQIYSNAGNAVDSAYVSLIVFGN
jgi:hypothetical protein